MSSVVDPSSSSRTKHQAQALVEFAIVVPVMLFLTLGLVDLGRAFVFGIAVQEGTREAARIAATANYDTTVADSAVLGRLVGASNPALNGCELNTSAQSCNGVSWTFSVNVATSGGSNYTSIAAARSANALAGSKVTVAAVGSVAMLPGVSTGGFGLVLPQIGVHGESAMVIL